MTSLTWPALTFLWCRLARRNVHRSGLHNAWPSRTSKKGRSPLAAGQDIVSSFQGRFQIFAFAKKRRLEDVQGTRTSFFLTFEFAGIARFVVSNVPNLRLEYETKPTWMEHVAIKGYWSFLAVWKRGKGGTLTGNHDWLCTSLSTH